jgi:hypothetical protein
MRRQFEDHGAKTRKAFILRGGRCLTRSAASAIVVECSQDRAELYTVAYGDPMSGHYTGQAR